MIEKDSLNTFFKRIFGKSNPDEPKSIINLPSLTQEDITEDNLSDMLNNGSTLIGETNYLHASNKKQFAHILGHHTMSGSMNIVSAYELKYDILCRYDLLALNKEDGEIVTFMVLSEAWRMNPINMSQLFKEQLSGFEFLYEDQESRILSGDNIVDLEYDDIVDHMNHEEHAFFSTETIEKYKGIER